MPESVSCDARWAIEIDRGSGAFQYYAIDSLVIDGLYVRIQPLEGEPFEIARDDLRKILVMRTSPSKIAVKPKS